VTTPNLKSNRSQVLPWIDRNRIFLLFFVILAFMTAFAPRFFNPFNLTTIMSTTAMNACVAIGFSIVMISGQLDLSIGTVITLAGIIGLGLQPRFGYAVSVPVAIVAGCLVGLVNGLLVTKAKINSFIVTLGTMTILQGVVYQSTGGNSIALSTPVAFSTADFLGKKLMPLVTPRILVTLALVAVFELVMRKTRFGRNFYMVGGNRNTAWLAGIGSDAYIIGAFMLSGLTAAVGGVFFAMESAAATQNLGTNSLMYVMSATIIGGTAMSGGKGGVFRSFVAILTLEILYDGVILFGLGNEVKIFLAGLILALVVLYEAYAVYKHDKVVGQRPYLLKELAEAGVKKG
jgi:ribose/xylose/arabinose/galactoside ABC-type transport system permease subunit